MEKGIEKKLERIAQKFKEIEESLGNPEVIADQKKFQALAKEHKELQPIYETYQEYKKTKEGIAEALEIIETAEEDELVELAKEEKKELERRAEELEGELKKLLIPKDPNDEKNVLLEIRAGAGGEEAALFAQDLFRMYTRYAERKGWKVEILSLNETGLGGIKEVVAMISGKGWL